MSLRSPSFAIIDGSLIEARTGITISLGFSKELEDVHFRITDPAAGKAGAVRLVGSIIFQGPDGVTTFDPSIGVKSIGFRVRTNTPALSPLLERHAATREEFDRFLKPGLRALFAYEFGVAPDGVVVTFN